MGFVEIFRVQLDLCPIYLLFLMAFIGFLYMYTCYSILENYNLFSGIELSTDKCFIAFKFFNCMLVSLSMNKEATSLHVPGSSKESTAAKATRHRRLGKYLHELRNLRKIAHVKGDGYCLIYSIIKCISEYTDDQHKYDLKEMIQLLRRELTGKNYSMYRSFLPAEVDLDQQLKTFEESKSYDQDLCDIFLLAICNHLNVEIVVVERTRDGGDELKLIIEPNCITDETVQRRTFYLLKTRDHYDPFIKMGELNLICVNEFAMTFSEQRCIVSS